MERDKMLKVIFVIAVIVTGYFLLKPVLSEKTMKTKIVFFGLGKSDSIYIENGRENMLIDSGLKEDKEKILLKLQLLKVEKLDYVILTHPDKDHIGGASYILDEFEIGEVIQSKHFKETKREAKIAKVIKEKTIKNTIAKDDMKFELGELKVTIFTPRKDEYEKDNDYSLVTLVEDGDLNYLFAGDAEKELLEETVELTLPKIDLYKVPHHGRKNDNSEKMIKKIIPKYSVITNFEETGEIDDLLQDVDSKIMYVYEKDLTFFSDGKELKFK
nr:MBL fold metallo-hydrolase [Tissierella sp.]